MTTTTTVNYTDEMVTELVGAYTEAETDSARTEVVNQYAEKFGKNAASIRAKLVREGVYVAKAKVTKAGDPIVRKADLVAQIEATTGVEFPSLVKASKADLVELARFIEAV